MTVTMPGTAPLVMQECPCNLCTTDSIPQNAYRPHRLTGDCWCPSAANHGTCEMTVRFKVRAPVQIGHP